MQMNITQNYVRNIPPHSISFRNSTICGYILCDILTSDGMFSQVHGLFQWDNERQMHWCHPALVFQSLGHNQGKQSNVYLKFVYNGNRVKIYITPSTTHYHYFSSTGIVTFSYTINYPDSKVHQHRAHHRVLSDPDGPHIGPINLAIRVSLGVANDIPCMLCFYLLSKTDVFGIQVRIPYVSLTKCIYI